MSDRLNELSPENAELVPVDAEIAALDETGVAVADSETVVHPPTDPDLFEREMGPHLDALYRSALRLAGNANDAEDLVQDTYLRAFRFFYQYQPGTNAKAWLFRIMNTIFLNDYRKKSRQADSVSYDGLEDFYLYNRISEDAFSGTQQQGASNPEDVVLHRLDYEAIEAAIGRLPVEFQQTVSLATLDGLAYQEISDILKIPIGTVRSRLSRGRKLLQKALWNQLSAFPDSEPEESLA